VDNPIWLGLIKQSLDCTGFQQIRLQDSERLRLDRVAVNLPKDRVLIGGFQGGIETQESAGTRNKDAHGLCVKFAGIQINRHPVNTSLCTSLLVYIANANFYLV